MQKDDLKVVRVGEKSLEFTEKDFPQTSFHCENVSMLMLPFIRSTAWFMSKYTHGGTIVCLKTLGVVQK